MTTDLIIAEIIPTAELIEINATDTALALLLDNAALLASAGLPTDRAGYEELHEATMVAVNVRTSAGKVARKIAAPYGEKYDAIIAEGKRIGEQARQAENLTRPLKEAYEEQVKAEKIARERAAADKINDRIMSLVRLGATYDAGVYTLGESNIDNIEVQAAPDQDWQELFTLAVVESEKIAARNREQEAAKQAEANALEAQKQAQETERVRLEAEAKRQQEEVEA